MSGGGRSPRPPHGGPVASASGQEALGVLPYELDEVPVRIGYQPDRQPGECFTDGNHDRHAGFLA